MCLITRVYDNIVLSSWPSLVSDVLVACNLAFDWPHTFLHLAGQVHLRMYVCTCIKLCSGVVPIFSCLAKTKMNSLRLCTYLDS